MNLKCHIQWAMACLLLSACGNVGVVPSASMSTVVVNSRNVADGVTPAQVTISLRSRSGNPVPGIKMKLWVSGADNVLMPCGATDRYGVAQCRFFSTRAETKEVVVSGNFSLSAQTSFRAP